MSRVVKYTKEHPVIQRMITEYRGGKTLEQVATPLHITRERVRQLLTKFAPEVIINRKAEKLYGIKTCVTCYRTSDTTRFYSFTTCRACYAYNQYGKNKQISRYDFISVYETRQRNLARTTCIHCNTPFERHSRHQRSGHGYCRRCRDKLFLQHTEGFKAAQRRYYQRNKARISHLNKKHVQAYFIRMKRDHPEVLKARYQQNYAIHKQRMKTDPVYREKRLAYHRAYQKRKRLKLHTPSE